MAQITVDQVWKRYGKLEAVKGISFECAEGEFLAILGPSGAGKTSTLKMIAGLEEITAGEVRFDGVPVNNVPPDRRNVAMVFETYALYAHLSVYDNMAFPLRSPKLRVPPAAIEERVHATARLLQIEPLLQRRPAHLSGGQRQRVALGRALVRQPSVFLMDEPISHLDAKLRHHMRGELKRLRAELQTTTIYVTHDYLEALALADRIVIINRGALQQIATPEEVFLRPGNVFVASIVGQPQMNLITCHPVARGDRFALESADGAVSVEPTPGAAQLIRASGAATVVVGMRPRDLAVSLQPRPGAISGKVYVFEPLGHQGLLTVRANADFLRVLTDADLQVDVDQPVWVQPDARRLHLFDGGTTANLLPPATATGMTTPVTA